MSLRGVTPCVTTKQSFAKPERLLRFACNDVLNDSPNQSKHIFDNRYIQFIVTEKGNNYESNRQRDRLCKPETFETR